MSEPYKLLCEARELLGKAHDKVAEAETKYRGAFRFHTSGVCFALTELIEQLNDACGACPMEPKPRQRRPDTI